MGKRKSPQHTPRLQRRGRGVLGKQVTLSPVTVRLEEAAATEAQPDRVWVQVATEGTFKGYMGGAVEFTFDVRTFQKIVANFQRHPSYQKGPDGYGMANVIPWDFHHASEMAPTDGSVPAMGAPAQGWIQELTVRQGEGGKSELWALTKWLEPARTYIKDGRYQWASVSVVFDAVDARTGENIGPLLTSVALTNQPFIEGMQKLAADRRVAADRYMRSKGMYIEAAETPERALEMIRGMLGLPETADAAGVVAELEKVKQWVTTGTSPLGVDLDEIIGGLRTILNLPSLSTNDEVFVEVDKLVARLLGDSGVGVEGTPALPALPEGTDQLPPEGTPPPPPDLAPAPQLENNTMDMLKVLAEKFGVVAKPEAIVEAADQLLELRGAAAKSVGLEANAATKIILKATLDDAAVRAKYGPILSALGVEDPDGAMDKIATLMQESAKLAEVTPEFTALKARVDEIEAAEQDEEVEAAAASTGVAASSEHYEGLKVALSHLRKSNPEEFAKRYPKEKLDKARAALSRTSGVDPKKLTTKVVATSTQQAAPQGGGATPQAGGQIDVSAFQGPNQIMRTMAWLCANDQRFVGKTPTTLTQDQHQACHFTASQMVRSGAVAG